MTQLSLFTCEVADNKATKIKQLTFPKPSYRQRLGLNNPPEGTNLKVKFMEGANWYLYWPECKDREDIVQAWFTTPLKARNYAKENKWNVQG